MSDDQIASFKTIMVDILKNISPWIGNLLSKKIKKFVY